VDFEFKFPDALMSNEETESSAIQKMRQYRDAYLNRGKGPRLSVKKLLKEMEVSNSVCKDFRLFFSIFYIVLGMSFWIFDSSLDS
jgi:hypothetical protein